MTQKPTFLSNLIGKLKTPKRRIILTGGRGFIGSHLLPLLEKNYSVGVIDLKEGMSVFDPNIEQFIKEADVVIHLAALTSVAQSFKNPGVMYYNNVLGTAEVLKHCAKYGKKIVFPSSAAVYIKHSSPYAYSKYLAEELVWNMRTIMPVTILRFFNVFGPNMNPDSGSIMYNFLTDPKLVIYGDGDQTRDFIHVRDVVRIVESAIDAEWDNTITDVGTGEKNTINYVAGLFKHFTGKDIIHETPRQEIKWSSADTSMLKRLYKKELTTNLEKDIEELCMNS
jgi:UDP-glucose 4-epimerase